MLLISHKLLAVDVDKKADRFCLTVKLLCHESVLGVGILNLRIQTVKPAAFV